jgi:hypothetical protein
VHTLQYQPDGAQPSTSRQPDQPPPAGARKRSHSVAITSPRVPPVPNNTPESDSDDFMDASAPSDAQIRLHAARRQEENVRRLLQQAQDMANAEAIEAAIALRHQAGTIIPTPPLSPPMTTRPTFFDWTSIPPGMVDQMNQLTLSPAAARAFATANPSVTVNDPYNWLPTAGTISLIILFCKDRAY